MKNHSLLSSCVLIECAAIAQAIQGHPDPVTVTFLCVGVTSVIHHCRLDAWWTRDVWRLLDYTAILSFAVAASGRFGADPLWICACAIAFATAFGSLMGVTPRDRVPTVHGVMHIAVGILVVCLVANARGYP